MEENSNAVDLAAEITTARLSNPNTRAAPPEDVRVFLKNNHAALVGMIDPPVEAAPAAEDAPAEYRGAVSARKNLADPEIIISMIDGKPCKALRRHLVIYGMTPETYRERYGLKADCPTVAPNYSKRFAEVAKALGLGRKRVASTKTAADDAAACEPAAAPKLTAKPKATRPAEARAQVDA